MGTFSIYGAIVDTDAEKETFEDVTPAQVNAYIKKLPADEELVFEINSPGGSCTAGIAIINAIKKAQAAGHKTTAKVVGIAASMASAIACACERLVMDPNSMLMIHLPWTVLQGNANDLRKEAETLDNFAKALVSIYQTKFIVSEDEIMKMLEAETWILGSSHQYYGLNCELSNEVEPVKIAASLKTSYSKYSSTFKNMPDLEILANFGDLKDVKTENLEEKIEDKVEEKVEEKIEASAKTTIEATTVTIENVETTENVVEDKTEDKTEDKIDGKVDFVTPEECQKRVSGMQAKMAKQIDALHKEYDAKIKDFENQLKVQNEELAKFKAEATSLKSELEKCNKELSEKTSAIEQKEIALATLNAGVNKMPTETQKSWETLTGKDFFNYMKKNNNIITIK